MTALQEVPKVPPVDVVRVAHDIEANLTMESDKALLWRLVEHPDMIGVWHELRKMDAKDETGRKHFHNRREIADEMWDPYLGGFFRLVFWFARQSAAVISIKICQPHVENQKRMARTLWRDARIMSSIFTANPDGTKEVSELHRKEAAALAAAAQVYEAQILRFETLLANRVRIPGFEKRRPGDPRAGPLAARLIELCQHHFGQPIFSVAATITNLALGLSGKKAITANALREAHAREKGNRKRAVHTTAKK